MRVDKERDQRQPVAPQQPVLTNSVLGAGLEPACLSAYAPQTYVSAIPPPEQVSEGVSLPQNLLSRKSRWRVKCLSFAGNFLSDVDRRAKTRARFDQSRSSHSHPRRSKGHY